MSHEDERSSLRQRLTGIKDLSKVHGGIDNIPPDQLDQFGYTRVGPGHIAPREVVLLQNQHEGSEKKAKTIPFERTVISLPAGEDRYRELQEDQITTLQSQLNKLHFGSHYKNFASESSIHTDLEYIADPEDTITFYKNRIPSQHPIHEFIREFITYCGTVEEEDKAEVVNDIFFFSTSAENFDVRLKEDNDIRIDGFYLDDDFFTSNGTTISPTKAKDLWQSLERKKSQLTDLDGLSPFNNFSYISDIKFYESYLSQHNIHNSLGLTRHLFGSFVASKGLEETAERLGEAETADEMKAILAKAARTNEISDALRQQEREIRAQLKTADEIKRRQLTAELSAVKQESKKLKRLLNGMVSYYETPTLFTDFVKRTITGAQKLLTYPSREDQQLHLTLDPTPNQLLDEDPGRVSGDCTAGKPLPFAEPYLPVFNVKVFDGENHMGNIYLLETHTTSGESVWHLEAIQIPTRAIKWREAVPIIINTFAASAREKDVSKITVNQGLQCISNYDYIESAVNEYWEQKDLKTDTITIPKNGNEKYSSFQGNGDVFVLWSQENPTTK